MCSLNPFNYTLSLLMAISKEVLSVRDVKPGGADQCHSKTKLQLHLNCSWVCHENGCTKHPTHTLSTVDTGSLRSTFIDYN